MKKLLISLVLALVLTLGTALPAMALETADVDVDATPSFISIINAPTSFDFLTVTAGVDENIGTGYFTITNSSTVATDIDIKALVGWEGGANDWTWGAPGQNTARLEASANTGLYGLVITAVDTDYELKDNLTALVNQLWKLELRAPTSFTYGNAQSVTVRLTASAWN